MLYRVLTTIVISLLFMPLAFPAELVSLNHKPVSFLWMQQKATTGFFLMRVQPTIKELDSHVDLNKTTHIRIKQMYHGYPVWGGDAIVHVPQHDHATLLDADKNSTMNGIFYQALDADLENTPREIFNPIQADKALNYLIASYQKKNGAVQIDLARAKKDLLVYIDENNKAHWSFLIAFSAISSQGNSAIPTYIVDANSFAIYKEWNDMRTFLYSNKTVDVNAGGLGGNLKTKELVYDGLPGHYGVLHMQRDPERNLCYLKNKDVAVIDDRYEQRSVLFPPPISFNCALADSQHNNLYWDADQDAMNGGYSPANDALYIGQVIKDMYRKWYNLEVIVMPDKKPKVLRMHIHARNKKGQPMEGAEFNPINFEMYFGDGANKYYPLTSIDVAAHEITHGFTVQHSNLVYTGQSGGINESFSDMAAQAAEVMQSESLHSVKLNDWKIGSHVLKQDEAIRYMDDPTQDGTSIDHVKKYSFFLDIHQTSGIFNKMFYLLSTSKDWDVRKAFGVMIDANMYYWTPNSTFSEAACGVIKATKGRHYDTTAVNKAITAVGIDLKYC